MKVVGLDGRIYNLRIEKRQLGNKSGPHEQVKSLLKHLFPLDEIGEEVFLPGASTTLYADFFLPNRSLVVEIHGRQHFDFVKHFHGTYQNFVRSKRRDEEKEEWCALNNIELIVLLDTESSSEWQKKILA